MADNINKSSILDFGEPEKVDSIIKVIGVGGGGGNAVNHMYREGIHDVPCTCSLERKDLAQETSLPRLVRQLKKPLMRLSICSVTARKWLSSLPEWVVEQVREQLLS